MEQNLKRIVVGLILRELIDSSSSDSDDEDLQLIGRNPRRHIPKIENYVEGLITRLTKKEFQAHFR